MYEKLSNEGYDIISIHLSDAISGTFNTATLAASEFPNVVTINSKTTSKRCGLLN